MLLNSGQNSTQRTTVEALQYRRAAEEILLAEWDEIQMEFDRTRFADSPEQIEHVMERYTLVIRRLKKFLTSGEVPQDVADQLTTQTHQQRELG